MIISTLLSLTACKKDGKTDEPELDITDFTVYTRAGEKVTLHEKFTGKPVVVNIWGKWCPYCVMELPDFEEAYLNNSDVEFMMINYGDEFAVSDEFLSDNGYTFPVYYDLSSNAVESYEVTGYPVTLFFAADGRLVKRYSGMISAESLDMYIQIIKDL